MKRSILLIILLLSCAFFAIAQRLPDITVPDHYAIRFEPDLKTAKFTGEETIDVRVLKTTSSVTLNSAELEVTGYASQGDTTQQATVTPKTDDEMIVLNFAKPLAVGPAKLHLKFSGDMANKLRGLYLSKTKSRNYATTQFEPTDARRAFPSFDEPALKATFDISVVADAGDTAISNAKIASDQPDTAGKHVITFETSPKMSTYLVALMVGDFKCIGADADGTPVRVCSVPGREQYMRYALDQSVGILKFYNHYYGIKYPFGKLDHIAIPDFEAGAMENTAAITYRETALLIEPNAPEDRKREVSEVIAHEMAHQWFGDLVTMAWWNDIWLNEGFASWMETKPVAAMHPEWHMAEDEVQSASEAMRTDSLSNTRPIRQQASTSGEINELFDAIAYNKTAAVLRMIETYIGVAPFQKGINAYLDAHKYANATAEDFWTAIARSSGKPVDKVMQSFVTQPGVPVITFAACKNGAQEISQSRFRFEKTEKPDTQVWAVPVCTGAAQCTLLTTAKGTARGCAAGPQLNTNGAGYYRADYPANKESLQNVTAAKPTEQIWFSQNEWALAYSGRHQITAYLDSSNALAKSRSRVVWEELGDRLTFIDDRIVTDAERPAFSAWAQSSLKPVMSDLGWDVKPGDTPEQKAVRGEVLLTLGVVARDPQAFTKAREITESYIAKPASVDPSLVRPALVVAASNGDAKLYDEYLAQMRGAKSPGEHNRFMRALTDFRDPALLERTLKLSLADDIRSQDTPYLILGVMFNPQGRKLAWDFVRTNWQQIKTKSSVWSAAAIVQGTSSFCDAQMVPEVEQFFETAKLPGAERTLRQSLERISECSQFRQAQQPVLAQFLQSAGGAHAGASMR
jgi:aminopeptidase N/puromycin-sensitive aminopeptidase